MLTTHKALKKLRDDMRRKNGRNQRGGECFEFDHGYHSILGHIDKNGFTANIVIMSTYF